MTTPADTAAQREDVREVIASLYRALGDRPAFDAHLDPGITIWESDAAGLLRGVSDLDDLRDQRASRRRPGGPVPTVEPEVLAVDVWDATALARSLLHVQHEGADAQVFRMTDVLRFDGRWRIVHHHAELERP